MHAVVTGFGLGLVVAAAIGPISLLCMRTVLRGATASGIAIGAGAAVIDASYAALGSAGAGRLLEIDALRTTLGLAGCVVLAWFGLRTLWPAFRVRLGGEADAARQAFLTSLAATASNPSTILSWAAVFAAVSTAGGTDAALLVAGVGCGTFTWFTTLSLGLTLARRRVGPRLLPAIDAGAGLGLLGFAGVLGVRSVRDAGA